MVVRQPDIVVVMTDQQRHDQVGFASGGHFETPNLDALAESGVVFTTAYSASTTCVPSRNALLTGIQPHRLPTQHTRSGLEEGTWTIAHALRRSGYETALIGKMHFTPMHASHGFDLMRTSEHLRASKHQLRPDGSPDLDDYHQWLVSEGLASWSTLIPGKPPKIRRTEAPDASTDAPFPYELRYHPTSWIEREVSEFLAARDRTRPLFLVVSFPHPHAPLNPLGPYRSLYEPADTLLPQDGFEVNLGLPRAFQTAMTGTARPFPPQRVDPEDGTLLRSRLTMTRALIRHIDDAFGRLLTRLDRDRSIVIFTSDHGDYAGHRGLFGKSPWAPFDDLVRVPLVISGPRIREHEIVDALVQSSDIPLTCCELAGIEVPLEQFDSCSLWPLLAEDGEGTDDDRVAVFATSVGWPGARQGALKLIQHGGATVLFDLDDDPGETTNRAGESGYREMRDHLIAAVRAAFARPRPELDQFPATTAA